MFTRTVSIFLSVFRVHKKHKPSDKLLLHTSDRPTLTFAFTNAHDASRYASDDFITGNFSDLDFFRFVVPFIKAQGVQVAIASFGEDDPEGLLSGMALIRKYE
jgi:hypothetical protein